MMFITWVRAIGIFAAVLSICRGQIFPFSNLKHFFDQKPRVLVGAAGAGISESESEIKPQTASPPSRTGAKASGEAGALLPTPVPTALPTPAPTTRFPIFSGPLSYFDENDGFRDFRMPDSAPQLSKHQNSKQKPKPPPQKQKPSDARAPLYIPLNIAYENSIGDGPPPSLFLTPPPPPNQVPDAAPSASHALLITNKEKLETAASSSLPPVPDLFLRPPSVNADMTFFKYPDNALSNAISETGQLELSDVAKAAVSVSKNPAIAKETSIKSAHLDEKVPPNHKTTTHPGNALDLPRHKDELGTYFKPVKVRKPDKGGENQNGPTNHRPDFGTAKGPPAGDSSSGGKHVSGVHNDSLSAASTPNKDIAVFESSPSEAAALGPSRPHSHPGSRHNHHKYPQPALHPNHRPQQQQQQEPQQPQLRPAKSGKPQKHGSNKGHNKHSNHQPDHRDYLEVEESMGRPKYRKKSPHHNHQPYQPFEQEVAESGLHSEGGIPHSSDGDRVEFQMHGLEGPKSYKFGYDTGKGHNRQFRYEERDPHGNVKGHYGYVDQHGKLQIVNYKADPHHGYSADVSKLQI